MKNVSALILLIAGVACGMSPATAETAPSPADKPVKKAPIKKSSAAKKNAAEEEKAPEVEGMQATAFDCELGNKLTVYSSASDDQQIALRWNKRLHRMTRVSTTTGAHRFEDVKEGLVWIGIPAKGMLLDSRKGRQLANECKSKEQTLTTAERK